MGEMSYYKAVLVYPDGSTWGYIDPYDRIWIIWPESNLPKKQIGRIDEHGNIFTQDDSCWGKIDIFGRVHNGYGKIIGYYKLPVVKFKD